MAAGYPGRPSGGLRIGARHSCCDSNAKRSHIAHAVGLAKPLSDRVAITQPFSQPFTRLSPTAGRDFIEGDDRRCSRGLPSWL